MKRSLTAAALAVALVHLGAPAALAADGVDAYDLADHKASVKFGATVTMWDCWERGVVPRFSAWNGSSWVEWAVGSVSTDTKKCPGGDRKVRYTYQVSLKGNPSKKGFNLLKVKEHCSRCETASWTLPVVVP